MGSNCCKGDAAGKPLVRTSSSIYSRSRAGGKLDDRFKPTEGAGGVRLTISTAQTGDSGVYTLHATNAAGKDSTRVRLEVSPDENPTGEDPPSFLRRLQDLTVKVGTRTRFLVEIVSSTECRVTWYRNERRLLEAERIALVRDGNFWCADISTVSVDDAGRWTCTAENVGGRASCSAHLNVLVPKAYKRPEFVEELRALLTEQGTVSLECKVVGVPTPVLRWFKDSREIKAGDVFALTANAEDPTSLGTYTCEAVNCMGRAYSSSKVHVIGRASREGSARPSSGGVALEPPPIFTKELEDQFVRICEPLNLSCNVVVPPWPRSVVWYNKEGKIESSDKYRVLEDGVGGYLLEVLTAEWPDEGEWKCVATSSGGRVGITTCYVSMDVPKNYRKPRFMENLQAVLTEEGLVSFECKVVGFPTPVLSWFKDGQELKPGDVYQLTGTNSLGSYCCIARNCMGQASSSAELTVEDIQNQLNEEEKLQLFSKNQAPKFLQGLKSVEAKIDEPFRFTIKVAIPPEPTVLWYRDDQPVDESSRCHHIKEERGVFVLDIQGLEFMDQAEWKCVAMNDFGHSVTSCFLKLIIPRHYKKPRFLENLQAILSDEGAVNLECKVIGVPQPVLKWYKDGEELKPGDIHRIISGQDGTCCLGTYTCEAQNCMGIAASSASLLGFEDSMKSKSKKKTDEQTLQRNLSLSTIHEERTSQMYDTPIGDITLDDKGEISFSFDGKEVSVSLYETPDLTEEEALQIVEMYADQLSENVTEHNVVELPPLRFVKETSTSGNLLMEAIIIDVSPEYFTSPEEDLRTEADIEDISIADENGPPQLSLDQDVEEEDYLEKTIALLSDEKADYPKKIERKKSDSQKSVDDYFSLSRDQSLSEEKKDDDTQALSESDLQSFASARSADKPKSKSSKPSIDDGQESSDVTKTVLLKEDFQNQNQPAESTVLKIKRERRTSRSSRRSSSSSEKSLKEMKEGVLEDKLNLENTFKKSPVDYKTEINNVRLSLTKAINDVQMIERDIILKSELMSTVATASRSLEIINGLITTLSEIHSITDAIEETCNESFEVTTPLYNRLPQCLNILNQSLTIIEKCIDGESDNKTLVKKTCMNIIDNCGDELIKIVRGINSIVNKEPFLENKCISSIQTATNEILNTVACSVIEIKKSKDLASKTDSNIEKINPELQHLQKTRKAVYELRNPLNSLLCIAGEVDITCFESTENITNSQIILNDMSTPIQDLQNALEQIEFLSVTESHTDLQKYNTEIIETVMDSVLKLRTSFEQLSEDVGKMGKIDLLNEILVEIKHIINEVSTHLDVIQERIGPFDILCNENKLEVLQKMAQILINLENNLVILDIVPSLKIPMADFHKNLTKVLEHVIESNDSTKYFTFLHICDAVNRLNTLLKNMDSTDMISLAGINNNLKIIQTNIEKNIEKSIFPPELNLSILSNIADMLVNVNETIKHGDISSFSMTSENLEDLSIQPVEEVKLNIVLERMEKALISISNVMSLESTNDIILKQALDTIFPTLAEIRVCAASFNVNVIDPEENISEMSSFSFTQTVAHPLRELNLGISVLNQVICEKVANCPKNDPVKLELAVPLLELRNALQILQQDVISNNGESENYLDVSISVANAVQSIQSCILMIQEQNLLESADEISTLDDISAMKTSADILSSDHFYSPVVQKTTIESNTNIMESALAQTLQDLNEQILILKSPEFVTVQETLSKYCDYNSIKSIVSQSDNIYCLIKDILQPMIFTKSRNCSNFVSLAQLATVIQPLKELSESLSYINNSNVTTESSLERDNIKLMTKLSDSVNDSLNYIHIAVETTDIILKISNNVQALQNLCKELKKALDAIKFDRNDNCSEILLLLDAVNNVLDSINCHQQINIGLVKNSIEKLYTTIVLVQDVILELTPKNPTVISHEIMMLKLMNDIENNIFTLTQLQFIDIYHFSEFDNHVSSYIPEEIKIEVLNEIENIIEITVNSIPLVHVLNNESNITQDLVEKISEELNLFCCLLKQRLTSKKILKMLQLFYDLHLNFKQFQLNKSEDYDKWMHGAEQCLKQIQILLVQILHNQSHSLLDDPISNIKHGKTTLHKIIDSKQYTPLHQFAQLLMDIIKLIEPSFEIILARVIEELELCNFDLDRDDKIVKNFNELITYLMEEIENKENKNKNIFETILNIIRHHSDCKISIGTGNKIIFIKCISDCLRVLEHVYDESNEKALNEDLDLKKVLVELSESVENYHNILKNICCQNLSNLERSLILKQLQSTELQIEDVINVIRKLEKCSQYEQLCLDNDTVKLAKQIHNNIYLIQESVKYLEHTIESANIISNQLIEEIERILSIFFSENAISEENKQLKENTESLLQHMQHYIEVIEIVEEVSAIIKLDDFKKSADIVRELQESITISVPSSDVVDIDTSPKGLEVNISEEQIQLVQNLQKALTSLQVQVLDSEQELVLPNNDDKRQQIFEVVTDLQNDLVALSRTYTIFENAESLSNDNLVDSSQKVLSKNDITTDLVYCTEDKQVTHETPDQYAIIELKQDQDETSHDMSDNTVFVLDLPEVLQCEETTSTVALSITPNLDISKQNKNNESLRTENQIIHKDNISVTEFLIDDTLGERRKSGSLEKTSSNTDPELLESQFVVDEIKIDSDQTIEMMLDDTESATQETMKPHINKEEYTSGPVTMKSVTATENISDHTNAPEVYPIEMKDELLNKLETQSNVLEGNLFVDNESTNAAKLKTLESDASIIYSHDNDNMADLGSSLDGSIHRGFSADEDIKPHEEKSNAIQELKILLEEVNESLDLSINYPCVQNAEELQDTLEQVQAVIIRLKCDFHGSTNDAFNENIEDLECNVRSVQLQVNEQSPPVLLKEACINLQTLVAVLSSIQNIQNNSSKITQNNALYNCINDAKKSEELLDKVTNLKVDSHLDNVVLSINSIKDNIKSLKFSFSDDEESLIDKGVEVLQNLDHVEDKVFTLERELDAIRNIDVNLRDVIVTAIHSIYGSISNMRGTVRSVQKKYMYENYGKPSDNFLKSLKHINFISCQDNKVDWKRLSKTLRKVLNHFEDVKFYINFDKTARLPSDAAFTKIILGELRNVLSETLIQQNVSNLDTRVRVEIEDALNCVNKNLNQIENRTTLEVKEKIPIFKDLSIKMLGVTNEIKIIIQNNTEFVKQPLKDIKQEMSITFNEDEVENIKSDNRDNLEKNDHIPEGKYIHVSQNEIEVDKLQHLEEHGQKVKNSDDDFVENKEEKQNIKELETNIAILNQKTFDQTLLIEKNIVEKENFENKDGKNIDTENKMADNENLDDTESGKNNVYTLIRYGEQTSFNDDVKDNLNNTDIKINEDAESTLNNDDVDKLKIITSKDVEETQISVSSTSLTSDTNSNNSLNVRPGLSDINKIVEECIIVTDKTETKNIKDKICKEDSVTQGVLSFEPTQGQDNNEELQHKKSIDEKYVEGISKDNIVEKINQSSHEDVMARHKTTALESINDDLKLKSVQEIQNIEQTIQNIAQEKSVEKAVLSLEEVSHPIEVNDLNNFGQRQNDNKDITINKDAESALNNDNIDNLKIITLKDVEETQINVSSTSPTSDTNSSNSLNIRPEHSDINKIVEECIIVTDKTETKNIKDKICKEDLVTKDVLCFEPTQGQDNNEELQRKKSIDEKYVEGISKDNIVEKINQSSHEDIMARDKTTALESIDFDLKLESAQEIQNIEQTVQNIAQEKSVEKAVLSLEEVSHPIEVNDLNNFGRHQNDNKEALTISQEHIVETTIQIPVEEIISGDEITDKIQKDIIIQQQGKDIQNTELTSNKVAEDEISTLNFNKAFDDIAKLLTGEDDSLSTQKNLCSTNVKSFSENDKDDLKDPIMQNQKNNEIKSFTTNQEQEKCNIVESKVTDNEDVSDEVKIKGISFIEKAEDTKVIEVNIKNEDIEITGTSPKFSKPFGDEIEVGGNMKIENFNAVTNKQGVIDIKEKHTPYIGQEEYTEKAQKNACNIIKETEHSDITNQVEVSQEMVGEKENQIILEKLWDTGHMENIKSQVDEQFVDKDDLSTGITNKMNIEMLPEKSAEQLIREAININNDIPITTNVVPTQTEIISDFSSYEPEIEDMNVEEGTIMKEEYRDELQKEFKEDKKNKEENIPNIDLNKEQDCKIILKSISNENSKCSKDDFTKGTHNIAVSSDISKDSVSVNIAKKVELDQEVNIKENETIAEKTVETRRNGIENSKGKPEELIIEERDKCIQSNILSDRINTSLETNEQQIEDAITVKKVKLEHVDDNVSARTEMKALIEENEGIIKDVERDSLVISIPSGEKIQDKFNETSKISELSSSLDEEQDKYNESKVILEDINVNTVSHENKQIIGDVAITVKKEKLLDVVDNISATIEITGSTEKNEAIIKGAEDNSLLFDTPSENKDQDKLNKASKRTELSSSINEERDKRSECKVTNDGLNNKLIPHEKEQQIKGDIDITVKKEKLPDVDDLVSACIEKKQTIEKNESLLKDVEHNSLLINIPSEEIGQDKLNGTSEISEPCSSRNEISNEAKNEDFEKNLSSIKQEINTSEIKTNKEDIKTNIVKPISSIEQNDIIDAEIKIGDKNDVNKYNENILTPDMKENTDILECKTMDAHVVAPEVKTLHSNIDLNETANQIVNQEKYSNVDIVDDNSIFKKKVNVNKEQEQIDYEKARTVSEIEESMKNKVEVIETTTKIKKIAKRKKKDESKKHKEPKRENHEISKNIDTSEENQYHEGKENSVIDTDYDKELREELVPETKLQHELESVVSGIKADENNINKRRGGDIQTEVEVMIDAKVFEDEQKEQNKITEEEKDENFRKIEKDVFTLNRTTAITNITKEKEQSKPNEVQSDKFFDKRDKEQTCHRPESILTKSMEYSTENNQTLSGTHKYSDEIQYTIQENTITSNIDNQANIAFNNKEIADSQSVELREHRDKEGLLFNNNYQNEQDYGLEIMRPSGYIVKSINNDDSVLDFKQPSNKRHTIYKSQTLINESQLRSSMPPCIDQRSKTGSESRSTLSEKRDKLSRDHQRKPVFSTHLTDRTAVESSRVKLTCSILSSTDSVISWYKNGTLLDNKQKYKTKNVDGLITLEILNAVSSDTGEYSCTVDNKNGSVTTSANLKVYPSFEASPIPPTFTRSIRDTYHLRENELVLECRIRGQPLPTISWLKDNRPIVLNERYQAHYLADGVCRLTIMCPNEDDSGKYTCKAENSMWSDQITHDVYFNNKEINYIKNRKEPSEKVHINRQAIESRRPHFTNVLSDHKVVSGGTIGLQVEISGSPTRVEWLREGRSVTETYRNAQTFVDHGLYTLALCDVTEKESGLYTCRAWSTYGTVDMNASITIVQSNQFDGKPATIISRPVKDLLISVGEDLNISFRVQGEPKAKVFLMKGIKDITNSQRVCKMTSDDYVKFTLKRSVISDAGTYCVFARNAYGCDRAFVTVLIRQRASSDNLISDWTYPMDDLAISVVDRNYKSVPDGIPSEPSAVDGGNNWISLAWQKPESQVKAPILAYKVESWLLGKEGGARWTELGITPRNSFDAFNLKQGEEYHFRITPRNRYGWGESVQTSTPIGIGLAGDRPEFIDILPGQLKVLVGETANLCCSFKGKPLPEIVWMKNGHEIEEDVERLTVHLCGNNTSLRINDIRIEDEGRYSCEATNIHGRSSTYSRMAVITDKQIWTADAKLKRERSAGVDGEYPPQFTMRLRDRRVQATYPVRLTCQVIGNTTPIVTWYKNGEEITVDNRHTTSQDEHFYTLEIAPTTLEDGGVYEALARNGCGAISCRCNLVVDKGIRAYIAPEFCCGFEPLYRVNEGDELRISAVIEAYPSVGVTWYRDGVRLRPSRRAVMTLDRDGQIELALASVAARDAGVYTCTASNEVGRASTSGKVEIVKQDKVTESPDIPPIVICPDEPYSKEPMFIRKPRSSEAYEGDTVLLVCEVIGDPKPDVYWLRDFLKPDYYRDASHFKRVGAGPEYRFEIPHAKLDYTGAYSIVAKNIHGEAKAIISLQILAKDPASSEDSHNIRYGRVEIIPRFDKELTDLLCYDGDAIEFECQVSGNPEPDIRWFHYTEMIPECLDFETFYELGIARLRIKQVTAEDEGTYTCEAANSMGKATSSACLVIYPPGEPNTLSQTLRRPPALQSASSTPRSTPRTTPARSLSRTPGPELRRLCSPSHEISPKFYTYPYNKVVEEGDTAVFQCAVRGLPQPWATWDKDGIIITPSSRISIKEKDDMFRILEIEQVTIEDVGLYRVTLENDYGRAEASARLEVISQTGKFYGSRSYSVSPRKSMSYRRRTPSLTRQD